MDEQQEIVDYLDNQCESVDSIIEKLTNENLLLNEHRTRLIFDVVTGKLDVRGVVVPNYEVVEEINDNMPDEDSEETEVGDDR